MHGILFDQHKPQFRPLGYPRHRQYSRSGVGEETLRKKVKEIEIQKLEVEENGQGIQ